MPTLSVFESIWTFALDEPGNFRFKEFGATNPDVSMKNINKRNIMSVMDAELNSVLTLDLFFNPIASTLCFGFGGQDCLYAKFSSHFYDRRYIVKG